MEPTSPPTPVNPTDDLLLLQRINRELLATNQKQQREIEQLQHRLHLLLKQLYGPRSEKMSGPGLFDDCELPDEPSLDSNPVSTADPTPVPPPESAKPTKPGHGRKKLPTNLPRVRIDHDLTDAEKLCPCCNHLRVQIGDEVTELLDYRPASLFVCEHHRAKYICRTCEPLQHQTAPMPPQPIDKGIPGPGLLSHLVTSKYADHLPLHRLEGILSRHGVEIARSTMSHWMAAAAQLLTVLYDRMLQRIRSSQVIHTDDTTVPVLDPLLNHTKTGRLWVYLGDRHHPLVYFDSTPTHARDGPERILAGYQGYLQADALPGYHGLYTSGEIHEVACWAHARRKFVDAKASDAARVHTALGYIGQLYDLESQLKVQTESDRLASRQAHARPILTRFRIWLEEQPKSGVLPKSPLGQAIQYALSNYDALMRYTEQAYLNIDNNLAERTLRLVAVGRNYAQYPIMRSSVRLGVWPLDDSSRIKSLRRFSHSA